MAQVTVKTLDEFDSKYNGGFKLVRDGLGVESFGMQVIDLPPNADQYPEHTHEDDGQEEVYTVLEGEAALEAGGERFSLTPGTFARVEAGTTRKLVTTDKPARVLALGGVPGKAYEVPEFSKPDAV